MGKIPFLTKRGGMYWFRRPPPLINAVLSLAGANTVEARPKAARGHLALSLRTRWPLEARRRAARICALFEFGWQTYETAMNQMIHPDAGADLQQEFARGLFDILRKSVEMAERLAAQVMPEPARAEMIDQNDAASRREIAAAAPQAARVESPAQKASSLDDPEFEAALMELADREGWWHDNPDEVVEQFDWMIVGLRSRERRRAEVRGLRRSCVAMDRRAEGPGGLCQFRHYLIDAEERGDPRRRGDAVHPSG